MLIFATSVIKGFLLEGRADYFFKNNHIVVRNGLRL